MAKALVGTEQMKQCAQLVNSMKKQSQKIPHLELLVEKYDGNRALLRRYRPLDPPHEHAQQNRDWMAEMRMCLAMDRAAIQKAKQTVRVWKTNSAKISRLAPAIAGWCSEKKIDAAPLLFYAQTLSGDAAEAALRVLDIAQIRAGWPFEELFSDSLTRTEKAVLRIIKCQPKNRGISGKEIIGKLARKKIALGASTLRRHVLPKLKELCGVVNQRAAGGYLVSL